MLKAKVIFQKCIFAEKFTHPLAILDVDEFFYSSEQIWRNVDLYHLLNSEASALNGCRQNESPNSW